MGHVLRSITCWERCYSDQILDALATEICLDDQLISQTIQAHVMGFKDIVAKYSPNASICVMPNKTIQDLWSRVRDADLLLEPQANALFGSMERVIDHPSSYPNTMHHQTADIILEHFREMHGCNTMQQYFLDDGK